MNSHLPNPELVQLKKKTTNVEFLPSALLNAASLVFVHCSGLGTVFAFGLCHPVRLRFLAALSHFQAVYVSTRIVDKKADPSIT